jgi:hypothetical protein
MRFSRQDCRVNVLRSFRELCERATDPTPCGCTPDFCTSLVETGQRHVPSCAYTLTGDRLTGDFAAAFPGVAGAARFEWSVGTDAGLDDEVAWAPTPDGEPRLDVSLVLDTGAAHYINMRAMAADGADGSHSVEVLSSRAQPMFGEECAHLRFVLRDGIVTLTGACVIAVQHWMLFVDMHVSR